MDRSGILHQINEIVCDELDDDGIELTSRTLATDVPGWDSLAHVRIVIAVESKFQTRFDTAEITGLTSVGDLVFLVEKYTTA